MAKVDDIINILDLGDHSSLLRTPSFMHWFPERCISVQMFLFVSAYVHM